MKPTLSIAALSVLLTAACASFEASAPPESDGLEQTAADFGGAAMDDAPMMAATRSAPSPGGRAQKKFEAEETLAGEGHAPEDGEPSPAEEGPTTRQWFPESFLWRPLVETDSSGTTVVDVRVPDTLTTWRVLALAHSREGGQGGAVHTFDSRLDVYVDPVTPAYLYAGDRLVLPIQVVNGTEDRRTAQLSIAATGALGGRAVGSVGLDAFGSRVHQARLEAVAAGAGRVSVELGTTDSVVRTLPVRPTGRPVATRRGGTLTNERRFDLRGAAGADPRTETLDVLVFPGALSVFQAELDRGAGGSATPWDAGYGFALASGLRDLSAKVGIEADADKIRELQLISWQRVVRHARAPSHGVASDLLLALGGVEDHELAEQLRPRLIQVVVDGQRGDGTWSRSDRSTLQRVLVQTGYAARALPTEEQGARLRASGAMERFAREIEDPFTAAVVVASGVLDASLEDRLVEIITTATVSSATGARTVVVPSGVQNPWGLRPSRAEMLTWTILALADADVPWRGDLVAELMQGYDAVRGFGAGPANALALQVIAQELPGLDGPVTVSMLLDGTEVARASLDPSQPKVPALLTSATRAQPQDVTLRCEPEVPGLAFVATVSSWVPWRGDEKLAGVDIEASMTPLRVGREGVLTLALAAPSGVSLDIEQGLPAGVTVDQGALGALGLLSSYEVRGDRLLLSTRAFEAGQVMDIPIRVQPGFAGTFGTPPLKVSTSTRDSVELRPLSWRVAPG